MAIPFTQYLRPYGHAKAQVIDRPDGVAWVARDLFARGVDLSCEVLVTGEVSLTAECVMRVEHPGGVDAEMVVLAHELVENGPPVPGAVDRLIERAWCVLFAQAMGESLAETDR